jgi:hypothetical protein
LQPDTAGTAPAFRRDDFCGRSRWRMADSLFVTFGSPMPTAVEVEAAQKCITEALFKNLEKLLSLKSPDKPFRKEMLELIALYRRRPDPAVCERKDLKDICAYFHNVLQHLHALKKLLPPSGKHDLVRSNFLLRILGQRLTTRRRFEGRDYLSFRSALDDLIEITKAVNAELTKNRVPPNLRLNAEKWLVRCLAEIFRERTRLDPRDHIKSNYDKTKYRGRFFKMTDDILTCVGHQQKHAARGRMIREVLSRQF